MFLSRAIFKYVPNVLFWNDSIKLSHFTLENNRLKYWISRLFLLFRVAFGQILSAVLFYVFKKHIKNADLFT